MLKKKSYRGREDFCTLLSNHITVVSVQKWPQVEQVGMFLMFEGPASHCCAQPNILQTGKTAKSIAHEKVFTTGKNWGGGGGIGLYSSPPNYATIGKNDKHQSGNGKVLLRTKWAELFGLYYYFEQRVTTISKCNDF